MMKLNRILSLLAFILSATIADAQVYAPVPPRRGSYSTPDGRPYGDTYHPSHLHNVYYGFRIGLSVASIHSESSPLDGNSARTGLNAGFAIGTQLIQGTPLCFESGLYYTEKGGKSNDGDGKFTYSLNYLEVPLLLRYKVRSGDIDIEPFLGGYLACGVGGKIKNYNDREAFSSYDDGYFRRFDGGIKVGVGFSFQMLYLGASYDIGLANVGQDDFDNTHTGAFVLNFGVTF